MLGLIRQMFSFGGKGSHTCSICNRRFLYTPIELRFYKENDVTPPSTCRLCRNLRRYEIARMEQPSIVNGKR